MNKDDYSDYALFEGDLLRSRRILVRTLYNSDGVVTNDSGRATAHLMNMAGLLGDSTQSAVASVLKAMEKDGWIEREVRGKRTFAISLNPEAKDVSRLIDYFESEKPEEEEVVEVTPEANDTSIVDAANVADELLLRVVEILNNPTSEDLHHRLGEQTEYANTMRARCTKMEKEIQEMKTSLEAKDARIAALNREKTQLESNLRAALKQEKSVVGSGIRALERFMQEIPRGRSD